MQQRKIDKVKWALYRAVEVTPKKLEKAKWVMYGAAALTTTLVSVTEGPHWPKIPPAYGD